MMFVAASTESLASTPQTRTRKKKVVDRLGVLGGYHGNQVLHEMRIRVEPSTPRKQ